MPTLVHQTMTPTDSTGIGTRTTTVSSYRFPAAAQGRKAGCRLMAKTNEDGTATLVVSEELRKIAFKVIAWNFGVIATLLVAVLGAALMSWRTTGQNSTMIEVMSGTIVEMKQTVQKLADDRVEILTLVRNNAADNRLLQQQVIAQQARIAELEAEVRGMRKAEK